MHSRGIQHRIYAHKKRKSDQVGIMNKYPCTPSLFQKLFTLLFFFFVFSPSFFFLSSPLVIFLYTIYIILQLSHISIHPFPDASIVFVHCVLFLLSFPYSFVLYGYNILYPFCIVSNVICIMYFISVIYHIVMTVHNFNRFENLYF